MRTFDPILWQDRARGRFHRAKPGTQRSTRLLRDNAAIRNLRALLDWCASQRLSVIFNSHENGEYFAEERKIFINSRLQPESQLFLLLHECGHHLIVRKGIGLHDRYGNGYPFDGHPTKGRTSLHHVDIVDEELEAWHRGLKLSQRLGVFIDVNRFNALRVKYIREYFDWALRRPKRSENERKGSQGR